jgi:AcrR family transcriptional regulator
MENNERMPAPARATAETKAPARGRRPKKNLTTQESLLEAAEIVFAKSGYDGATVQRIAKQAKCYESLIYYHFGSKDGLFTLVLENAYRKLIDAELALDLDFEDPEDALEKIILFQWQYYQANPELIILLNTENLLKGQHLAKLKTIKELLPPAISNIEKAVASGIRKQLFRDDIDIVDLYLAMMGLGYFYLSNRYTLSAFLDRPLMDPQQREHWGRTMVQMVFASVRR